MKTGSLILVGGVDGVGKSTLIKHLESTEGLNLVGSEPTSTPESQVFKINNLDTVVSTEFVHEREGFYLDLQSLTDQDIDEKMSKGFNVVTSGNCLTTYISHTAMRGVLGMEYSPDDILSRYNSGEHLTPDSLIVLHAPLSVMRDRIGDRLAAGDKSEKPWGFNSPFFLERYQEAWMAVADVLRTDLDWPVLSYDTSTTRPNEIVIDYLSKAELN